MNAESLIPGIDLTDIVGSITVFFFLMIRIGAFLIASPAFGGRYVPLPVRIVATVVLTLPLFGRVDVPMAETFASLASVPYILAEIFIGVTAGLTLNILFGVAAIAGDRIASTAGLGFASQIDPSSGGQTPVVAQLFGLLLTLVFLSLDGHLSAIGIMLDSYRAFPPGQMPDPAPMIRSGITAGSQMFLLAAQVMLPVVGILLLINVTIGVITRSAPQLNIFSFGFPVTMTAAIVLLFLTTPGVAAAFRILVENGTSMLTILIGDLANG